MSSSMHIQIIHKKCKYSENLLTDFRKNCPQNKIFLRVADKDLTHFGGKKAIVQLLRSSFLYRKRLPQQNGDRRKRNLHAFQVYVGQGWVPAPPPPPPTRDKKAGLVYYGCPPPLFPWTKISDFQAKRLKRRTASF